MDLQKEIQIMKESLQQQRDEIAVQIHLAAMDTKDEWEEAEAKLGKFVDNVAEISDDAKETTAELLEVTKIIGDELKEAYKRIVDRIAD